MSAKHRAVQRPAPSAKPRLVVAPTENVLAALKVLTDLIDALTLRVEALEASAHVHAPGITSVTPYTGGVVGAIDAACDLLAGGGNPPAPICLTDEAQRQWDALCAERSRAHAPTDSEGAE